MATHSMLRVLIVDDEPGARRRLERLLSRDVAIEIVDQVGTGREAVEAIGTLKPDLVFLDVQMPGMTGIDVVREIGAAQMPAVIFVTAYDQYAVRAFDLAALDYLLKPFDDERFEQALARARQHLARPAIGDLTDRLDALLHAGTSPARPEPAPRRYLERIAVEIRGQLLIVPVDKISFISAKGNYVYLHVGDDTLLVREQMQCLEEQLPPDQFSRIHRSFIVRLSEVETLLYKPGGHYVARLRNGKLLKVSRSRWEAFTRQLGIQTPHAGDRK